MTGAIVDAQGSGSLTVEVREREEPSGDCRVAGDRRVDGGRLSEETLAPRVVAHRDVHTRVKIEAFVLGGEA